MQDKLIWAIEFMAEHEGSPAGETVGGFGRRVRSFVERALALGVADGHDDTLTDLICVVEEMGELFHRGELLTNALFAIPCQLAAEELR